MSKTLLILIGLYLLAVNLIAFILMGVDKRRAKKDRWRISEGTLFLFPVLGGSLGGILGMKLFRHKTRHWYFRFGFPALLLIQVAAAGWLLWKFH